MWTLSAEWWESLLLKHSYEVLTLHVSNTSPLLTCDGADVLTFSLTLEPVIVATAAVVDKLLAWTFSPVVEPPPASIVARIFAELAGIGVHGALICNRPITVSYRHQDQYIRTVLYYWHGVCGGSGCEYIDNHDRKKRVDSLWDLFVEEPTYGKIYSNSQSQVIYMEWNDAKSTHFYRNCDKTLEKMCFCVPCCHCIHNQLNREIFVSFNFTINRKWRKCKYFLLTETPRMFKWRVVVKKFMLLNCKICSSTSLGTYYMTSLCDFDIRSHYMISLCNLYTWPHYVTLIYDLITWPRYMTSLCHLYIWPHIFFYTYWVSPWWV